MLELPMAASRYDQCHPSAFSIFRTSRTVMFLPRSRVSPHGLSFVIAHCWAFSGNSGVYFTLRRGSAIQGATASAQRA